MAEGFEWQAAYFLVFGEGGGGGGGKSSVHVHVAAYSQTLIQSTYP